MWAPYHRVASYFLVELFALGFLVSFGAAVLAIVQKVKITGMTQNLGQL